MLSVRDMDNLNVTLATDMLEDVVMHNQTKNGEHLYVNDKDYPSIIVITCMLSLFSIVGTTGNAFVLYVFSRKKDKNTSTIFILALASIDFVTCLFLIPFTIVVEFMYKRINSDAVCKLYQFFITSNVPFSAFIMVAIAFDRYFCICRPWMKCFDTKIAKRIIVSLLLFSLTLGVITSLAYGVYHRKPVKKVFRNDSVDLLTNNFTRLNAKGVTNSVLINTSANDESPKYLCRSSDQTRNESDLFKCQFRNVSGSNATRYTTINENDFTFTGFCYPNEVILSREFRRVYQTFYASLFLIAFISVFILYALIYKSILQRRSKRLRNSVKHKYHSGKRTNPLSCIFTRRRRAPDAVQLKPCDPVLSNQLRESNARVSEISFAQVSTGTLLTSTNGYTSIIECSDREVSRVPSNYSICLNNKHMLDDVIKEESAENASTGEVPAAKTAVTPNDLKPPEMAAPHSPKKRPKRTGRCVHLVPNGEIEKSTNKTIIVSTSDNGTKAQQENNFKITTYNICRKDTRKSVREKHRVANIKTAGILFIVTLVFIVAFLPAWLMATKIIPPNMIIFYSYFVYNVANPVIYAFFNQAFQKEVKTVLKCSYHT